MVKDALKAAKGVIEKMHRWTFLALKIKSVQRIGVFNLMPNGLIHQKVLSISDPINFLTEKNEK